MLLNKSYFQAIAICVLALIQIPAVFSIAGGQTGDQTKLQYVVKVTINGVYVCSGALVSNRHVVTVYHCVYGVDKAKVKVEGGTIASVVTLADLIPVAEIYKSPFYNQITHYMDVAVLKLAAVVIKPNMVPISLCEGGWDPMLPIQISGWGLKAGGEAATILQTATVAGIPNSNCESILGGSNLPESLFCAAMSGTANTCIGDDGAPAVVNNKLCGLASIVGNCENLNMPGLYTNINGCKNFLDAAMKM